MLVSACRFAYRALRIFDTVIKHWENLGGSVVLGTRDGHGNVTTKLELHGDQVPVELYEDMHRISTQPAACRNWKFRNCKYEATGRLVLNVDLYADAHRSRWADGKRQRLETVLVAFTEGLITILEIERAKRLDRQFESRKQAAVKAV